MTLPVAWVSKSKLISIISFPVQVSDKMYAIVDMLLLRFLKRFPDNFPFLEISKRFPDNFLFLKSQPFYSPFNLVQKFFQSRKITQQIKKSRVFHVPSIFSDIPQPSITTRQTLLATIIYYSYSFSTGINVLFCFSKLKYKIC